MNRYKKLMVRIQNGEKILIDGATGTEVERRGVPPVKHAWNAGGAKTHPDLMRQIHADYIALGAEIVISNTFATGRSLLEDAGWADEFDLLNRRGVELCIEAREAQNKPDILVAGGISHWWWKTEPANDVLRKNTRDQAIIMKEAGADLIMLEMMCEIDKTLIVLEESLNSGLPVWVGFSCQKSESGEIQLLDNEELLADAIKAIEPYNIPLISIMHTRTPNVDDCLDVVQSLWSGPIGVYAHSG
ncbi:MAG: homocysteine S-methyltransferase family protein, partial [Chloroflexota bacterium]